MAHFYVYLIHIAQYTLKNKPRESRYENNNIWVASHNQYHIDSALVVDFTADLVFMIGILSEYIKVLFNPFATMNLLSNIDTFLRIVCPLYRVFQSKIAIRKYEARKDAVRVTF
jgi:hypothetical protein